MKIFLLLLLPVFGFTQSKLDTITILNGKVKMLSPKELSTMSDQMWKLKYRNIQRPDLVLTDDRGEVNLLVNMTGQQAREEQLEAFKNFQLEQLKKNRPDITVFDAGIKLVDGKKVVYYKFASQAIDQQVFNYSFYIIVDGKLVQFAFNCIQKIQEEWAITADKMVASLRVE